MKVWIVVHVYQGVINQVTAKRTEEEAEAEKNRIKKEGFNPGSDELGVFESEV